MTGKHRYWSQYEFEDDVGDNSGDDDQIQNDMSSSSLDSLSLESLTKQLKKLKAALAAAKANRDLMGSDRLGFTLDKLFDA